MRLWSLHPMYLDSQGLVACWREALLAKKVLEGKTKGYKSHPQLERFKQCADPIQAIQYYLYFLWLEADMREYNFDRSKVGQDHVITVVMDVKQGQVLYEAVHLAKKLKKRKSPAELHQINHDIKNEILVLHPSFSEVRGESLEPWEKVKEGAV